eukprot:g4776.t1
MRFLTRIPKSLSTTPQTIKERLTGFLAGITNGSNGLNFDDTYDLLQEVPENDLVEWEKGHFEDHAQIVRYGSEEITVLDTMMDSTDNEIVCSTALRTLIFNRRVDLQQSRSLVQWPNDANQEEIYDFSSPDSLIRGLSIAAGIRTFAAENLSINRESKLNSATSVNICVLGGGGCSLPMYLRESLRAPKVAIDCVEISEDVRFAAREYFGVARVEQTDPAFQLVDDCAIEWTLRRSSEYPESIDILVIDIESGEDAEDFDVLFGDGVEEKGEEDKKKREQECWLAPPKRFLSNEFLRSALTVIKPYGCICINTIASIDCFEQMRSRIRAAGFVCASYVVPFSRHNRQRLIFCVRETDASILSPGRMAEAAAAYPELFPENFDEWLTA